MKIRLHSILLSFLLPAFVFSDDLPTVSNLTAKQRYPWNGLVDIECDIAYSDANADLDVSIVATNTTTGLALPVWTVHVANSVGMPVKPGHHSFIWDAGADVPNVKIDDVALTVDAKVLGGIQLWENGPYWAECNVGATKPEDYGYYYWWGDTVGYKRNNGWVSVADGSSFSFGSGNCPTYGKKNTQLQSEGWIDASGNLVAAHDAATANLGAPWRMPTDAEWDALIRNCDMEWTTQGGVSGRLVKGRGTYSSHSIFLPAAGYGDGSYLWVVGSYGYYWSSTPCVSGGTWILQFNSNNFNLDDGYYGSYGQPVRALRGFAQ